MARNVAPRVAAAAAAQARLDGQESVEEQEELSLFPVAVSP